MTLDQRADAAVRELLAATDVDVTRRLADLRATRRRRDAGRVAALAVAAAALVGATAWVATGTDDDTIQPAPAPTPVSNGALVGSQQIGLDTGAWRVLEGPEIAYLPEAKVAPNGLQFTPDGRHIVTVDQHGRVLEMDVRSGALQVLATCPSQSCHAVLSPDGRQLVWSEVRKLVVQDITSGVDHELAAPDGNDFVGLPSWSPDGSHIGFIGSRGVYVTNPDGRDLTLVHRTTADGKVLRPPSFSADGTLLAFVEGLDSGTEKGWAWGVVVAGVDGTSERRVLEAGSCMCLGVPPPAVVWSPDGSLLATTTTQGEGPGVYVFRPDGTDVRELGFGPYADVAWQPLPQ